MQNQVDQVESQSNFSLLYECHGKSAPEGSKGSLYFGENCLEQKLLGENNDELCNARTTQSDLSDCMADEPTPRLRNVVNADENACLHGQQESCEAEENLKQKSSTLQDLYAQEYYDDEDDDDSDWEPASHFVIKKWFCANCTMPNFDDVCHCDVCGEHRESDFFRYDLSQLHVGGEVVNSYKGADSSTETCTAIGFDERMLLHSEVEMKSHPHPERPDRLRAIAASLAAAGIFPGKCTFIPPREITQEALLMVHSLDHIEAVQQTRDMLSSYFTPDTYANEHSACAARLAAGLCADLARTIMSGHARNGFALVRPPGHHAGIKQAMGFCLHNNAAIAALAAQSAGAKKVLIVDWDVHHGNGTQEIFDGNKSVLYVSLHRHEGGRFYPGTGAAYEVGMVDAKGYSVNIPWSCGGVGDNDYIFAFQHVVLPIALEFAPDITIISAGFDAARGDPLGCCDVTPAGYAQMTHMLTGLSQGKLLVILEGGYNLRSISSSATAVVKVLLGEDPGYDPSYDLPAEQPELLPAPLSDTAMKQLHKQPSLNQQHQIPTHTPSYSSKSAKQQTRPSSFLRSAATYLLREQRLLFVLAGALIASTFFLLSPYYHSSLSRLSFSSPDEGPHRFLPSFHDRSLTTKASVSAAAGGGGGGRRVPAGLRKPALRIVVTGGAGFVGSHLVDKLLARGDSVIVLDNFFTGRKDNLVHHFGNPRFELIRHDVVEPILLEVDQIYHLACPASPVHYKYNPIKTIKTNVMGTLNMLGLAKRIGARFLLTSTSEVYGDPLEHPQKETYWGHVNPIGVRSCYDEGKRTAETLSMDYHRGAGVEVRIARIFNTYGPRMCLDDGRVVSNFVAQALRKQPMTVYGDGKQTRSFQYVSDLVDGLVALMEGEHIGPFNLGNPGEFTMLELAEVVKETVDPSASIEFRPNTADDPHMRKPDITKAKELLNWEPKISLRQGLPLMVTDFRKRLNEEK